MTSGTAFFMPDGNGGALPEDKAERTYQIVRRQAETGYWGGTFTDRRVLEVVPGTRSSLWQHRKSDKLAEGTLMTTAVPDDQPAAGLVKADSDQPATGLAKAGSQFVEQLLRVGIDGFGPFKSAQRSAEEACKGRTNAQAIKALKRNHCLMAGSQGFVTNIGGFLTMPVTLPANIGASYLIQTHLAAAIASVHGHDLDDEEVQSAILLCLLGNAGAEVVKQAGIKVGTKYTVTLIRRIPISAIREINKRAGFMLLAKFGTKRATITLARGVPLVGGGIGGTVDAVATQAVGTFADKFFRPAA